MELESQPLSAPQQLLTVGVSNCSSFRSCTASDWNTHVTAVSSGICWYQRNQAGHTDFLCDLVAPNQVHPEDSDVTAENNCNYAYYIGKQIEIEKFQKLFKIKMIFFLIE